MHKILVVDDETSIVTLLKFNLEQNGFEVVTANDGLEAIEQVKKESPDVMVLDLMLPKMDGMDVVKTLRLDKIHVPVLMLTAKDDEFDKILGLEMGADDYMTKPFSPREVVARVRAILRRIDFEANQETTEDNTVIIGELTIDYDNYAIYKNDKKIDLTKKEYELLVYLSKNNGRVLSRDQLLNGIWQFDFDGDTRIVDVHIGKLREKIEDNPKSPKYIHTVRGFGYKMEYIDE
ncbi:MULTISPECIES: response regulator transcription factor [Nosocomiicoccus]|uniref:response regulator transcription factor n=1 Tax=Nosocomiicoccus TaxID=489909 RepID=UPI000836CD1F|nr:MULTISPECIES: response regulator transcription factor [Nosocomiicoccus]MDK6863598.1 response regulator transcription factor [Nosocomiicoccus ampullae]OFL48856.1 DNA-binding response regulator [Nosocomiicoccus sp. HMSC067E10]OFO53611.1 DNA-binding response regulator [Nosocomiicoccus sp. HMSC059G07]